MKIEVVAYNLESVKIASRLGASRIELCSNFLAGGMSPSLAMLQTIKEQFTIPVYCMVRPREGDFFYTSEELGIMLKEIAFFKKEGADGIVCGVLHRQGDVNREQLKLITEASYPLPVTFHRAFDFVSKPFEALEQIIECGCARILTSGMKSKAIEGIQLIKDMIEVASGRIQIMPGAGINENNALAIMKATNCNELHLSATKIVTRNTELNKAIQIGAIEDINEWPLTNEEVLQKVLSQFDLS